MCSIVLEAYSQVSQGVSNPNKTIKELKIKLSKDKLNCETLKELSSLLINQGNYDQTIFYARKLDSISRIKKEDKYQLYAGIYLGQALMMNGVKEESRYYMDKSLELATGLANDSALASVYNGLGLYAANIEMDYYRSINYFFQGIQAAKKSANERLYSILLCNISGIYYLKKDSEGLKYALECYELGHKKRDSYLMFCGSTNAAYLYFLMKDYEKSLKYIKEAEVVAGKNNFYDKTGAYTLHGNILMELGDDKAAIEMFTKALQYTEDAQTSSIAYAHLSFAKALIRKSQYHEAVQLLQQGLDISIQNKNAIHISEQYEYLSKACELQHDYKNALEYYKSYHHLSDSIFNQDKERTINELRIKYDTEKHENEVKQSALVLLQKEKKLQLLFFAFILIILILGGTYALYYKKHKLYLQIVKRNQEAVKREALLNRQIDELMHNPGKAPAGKYSGSSLSDEKGTKLYQELENLMRNEHVYRQNDLTTERLADMLHTNRTYLSQVINKYVNLTFTYYINTFRIEEAVRILSDPDNDIPLKALSIDLGFNSMATFYTAFQASMGMSPSLYRRKVQLLKKNKSYKNLN
ncbi:MAG: helix-turn-helix domain-containing protein [Prevotellaceae bacterium]|nr:helix-turn-helix domain-containing protein [Prevotellaceae bacterium]